MAKNQTDLTRLGVQQKLVATTNDWDNNFIEMEYISCIVQTQILCWLKNWIKIQVHIPYMESIREWLPEILMEIPCFLTLPQIEAFHMFLVGGFNPSGKYY